MNICIGSIIKQDSFEKDISKHNIIYDKMDDINTFNNLLSCNKIDIILPITYQQYLFIEKYYENILKLYHTNMYVDFSDIVVYPLLSIDYVYLGLVVEGNIIDDYNFVLNSDNIIIETHYVDASSFISPILIDKKFTGFISITYAVINGHVKFINLKPYVDNLIINNKCDHVYNLINSMENDTEVIVFINSWKMNHSMIINLKSNYLHTLLININEPIEILDAINKSKFKITAITSDSLEGIIKISKIMENEYISYELKKLGIIILGSNPEHNIDVFSDKGVFSIFMSNNLELCNYVPKTLRVNSNVFPCIIKKNNDMGGQGNIICRNESTFNLAIQNMEINNEKYIIQELIENIKDINNSNSIGYECETFSINGNIMHYFALECVVPTYLYRQYGIGLKCQPTQKNPVIISKKYIDQMEKILISNNKFNGFCDFNLTFDDNGDMKLFEINPRASGYLIKHLARSYYHNFLLKSCKLMKLYTKS
jgi:hypothetical protein